jgi:hypothetical protein
MSGGVEALNAYLTGNRGPWDPSKLSTALGPETAL